MGPSTPLAIRIVCSLLYSILLVVMSLISPSVAPARELPDTWVHAGAYAIHAAMLFWTLSAVWSASSAAVAAFVGSVVLGAGVELLQAFHPARTPDLRDVLFNAVGAAFACVVAQGLRLAIHGRERG